MLVAGSALVPVAVIGISEAIVSVSGAIEMAGTAVISTSTGAALSTTAARMTNTIRNELTNSITELLINGPSLGVGAIQGYMPPSPVIFNNVHELFGFTVGFTTSKLNEN